MNTQEKVNINFKRHELSVYYVNNSSLDTSETPCAVCGKRRPDKAVVDIVIEEIVLDDKREDVSPEVRQSITEFMQKRFHQGEVLCTRCEDKIFERTNNKKFK